MLNLPVAVFEKIKNKKHILISGMGGGFDVYAGLPLYYYLTKLGKKVTLANYTFSNIAQLKDVEELKFLNNFLVGTKGNLKVQHTYFPEGYLAEWLNKEKEIDTEVWMFPKVGPKALNKGYKKIIDNKGIDCIFLVDGGVDSLMIGDEEGKGTIVEDSISLAAINSLEIEIVNVAIGFGTEVEEKVCHHSALENISRIIRQGGFYGSCSLVNYMNSFQFYKEACEYTFNQPNHKSSHISSRIIPATEGSEAVEDSDAAKTKYVEIFLSPLMSIMWFFDSRALIYNNKLVPYIEALDSFQEVVSEIMPRLKEWQERPRKSIPY